MRVCVVTKTLASPAIQVFGLFRVFGEQLEGQLSEQRETEGPAASRLLAFSFLEPERDSTANRTTTSA